MTARRGMTVDRDLIYGDLIAISRSIDEPRAEVREVVRVADRIIAAIDTWTTLGDAANRIVEDLRGKVRAQ
jgi:hypothetical protein